VVGTFLPWLRSGTVDRNSYAAGDALSQVEHLPSALLATWPYLSILCALAAALALVGARRWAFGLGAFCAIAAGVVSVVVLVRGSSGLVRAVSTGPGVTLIGVGVISVSVVISLAPVASRQRRLARPVGGTDDHS
jgi:hypothetical protein